MMKAFESIQLRASKDTIMLFSRFQGKSKICYRLKAIYKQTYFVRPDAPDEYKHLAALGETINHATLLEEFIFWTFKLEFPQNIVCFLLNMIPEQDYKVRLTSTCCW